MNEAAGCPSSSAFSSVSFLGALLFLSVAESEISRSNWRLDEALNQLERELLLNTASA